MPDALHVGWLDERGLEWSGRERRDGWNGDLGESSMRLMAWWMWHGGPRPATELATGNRPRDAIGTDRWRPEGLMLGCPENCGRVELRVDSTA